MQTRGTRFSNGTGNSDSISGDESRIDFAAWTISDRFTVIQIGADKCTLQLHKLGNGESRHNNSGPRHMFSTLPSNTPVRTGLKG